MIEFAPYICFMAITPINVSRSELSQGADLAALRAQEAARYELELENLQAIDRRDEQRAEAALSALSFNTVQLSGQSILALQESDPATDDFGFSGQEDDLDFSRDAADREQAELTAVLQEQAAAASLENSEISDRAAEAAAATTSADIQQPVLNAGSAAAVDQIASGAPGPENLRSLEFLQSTSLAAATTADNPIASQARFATGELPGSGVSATVDNDRRPRSDARTETGTSEDGRRPS
ncbi:MAG: hypothetical protein RIC36_08565 [Rhodospirillales bacterium]